MYICDINPWYGKTAYFTFRGLTSKASSSHLLALSASDSTSKTENSKTVSRANSCWKMRMQSMLSA